MQNDNKPERWTYKPQAGEMAESGMAQVKADDIVIAWVRPTLEPKEASSTARRMASSPDLERELINARKLIREWFLKAQPDEGRDTQAWSEYEKNDPAMNAINNVLLNVDNPL